MSMDELNDHDDMLMLSQEHKKLLPNGAIQIYYYYYYYYYCYTLCPQKSGQTFCNNKWKLAPI